MVMRHIGALLAMIVTGVGCAAQQRPLPPKAPEVVAPSKMVGQGDGIVEEAPIKALEEVDPNSANADEGPLGANASVPCDDGTPEHKGAETALDALGAKIDSLDNHANPKKLTEELEALLQTPCFELANRDLAIHSDITLAQFDSGLALKTWWTDGGAEQWLRDYGRLKTSRWITFPGTPRHSLFLENHKTHVLLPLLCPATAGDCGKETIGWARRTEATLTRRAAKSPYGVEDCEAKIKQKDVPIAQRYSAFLDCKKDQAESHDALPLGRFKSPQDGLFVIDGRSPSNTSGGYGCKELRVYDLATGAADIVEECPVRSWSSTHGPNPQPGPRVISGKVPLAALREAVWMLLLASTVDTRVRSSEMINIPEGVTIGRPSNDSHSLRGFGRCGGGSRVVRSWSWMRKSTKSGGGALEGHVSGKLITPSSFSASSDHAGELMGVFEDGFTPGCSPKKSAAMTAITWSKPGPSLVKDEKIELDRTDNEPLRIALAKAAPPKTCEASP